MATSTLKIKRDGVESLSDELHALAQMEVLVGFPEDSTDRQDGELDEPTNAALAYIHDNGAPEQNIPQREFMRPAIEEVQERLADQLGRGAKAVLEQRATADQVFARVGSIAELAIKNKINTGVPPPLAESTLRARAARGREGAMWELAWRAHGGIPSTEMAKTLVDTAQMRNAVKYVIRNRKKRDKE